ncbi:hypothetical protein [Mycobacterium colombiense]|uniref:hypothetical protein n=1 Tax=Mycobacterium colombiense TaxID=339268 RepID=UPI00096C9CC8|nr:hypothetical protein [Mycobacterium colombiense]OMB93221.1 hypothetical protein A5732_16860 [Mycobacterium colombiense]
MGYFAVLKPADADDGAEFSITRCHINLWALRSFIPGRRLLYFDLGLEISATGTKPIHAVEVLLPFKVEEGYNGDKFKRCMDLYDALLHDETAELIFGEPVTVSGPPQDRKLALESGAELHPRHIDTAKVVAASDEPPRSSCYLVPLNSTLACDAKAYVRFRFRVFANRPMLTAKSPFGGLFLDFRIADVRESRSRSRESSIRRRIVPIDKVNFFAMLPDQYQLLTASSEPRNMRILETRAWGTYLNRVAYMHPSNAQLVYYWRSDSDSKVSSDNPFRVFASFDRHLNKAKIVFWCTVAALFTAGLVRSDWLPGITTDSIKWALGHLASFLGLLSLGGIIAACRWGFKFAMNRFAKLRLTARWVERLLLGLRLGP